MTAAWPWLWPTLLLLAWIVGIAFSVRQLFKTGSWHTIEDPRVQRAVRAVALLLVLGGAAGWLAMVPLLSDNLDHTFNEVWPWFWPSLLAIAVIELARTADRWARDVLGPRLAALNDGIKKATFDRLVRALTVSAIAATLAGWSQLVPLSAAFENFIEEDVLPWVWPTVLLVTWIVVGLFATRKAINGMAKWAERTQTSYDDAVVDAIRRPFWLIVVTTGFALWASLTPMPTAVTGYIDAIAKAAAVFMLVMFADAFSQSWMQSRSQKSKVLRTSGGVLRSAAKVLIYLVGILMVLSTVGIDITPLIASLGVGSIAVGLALQKTLEDFLAGLILAADQPIRVGDFVTLEPGLEGTVLNIGWRSTQMRTRDDMHVIVPNSKLASATLINRSMPSRLVTFTIPVGVAYGTDLGRAAAIASEVGKAVVENHPAGVSDYEPKVVFGEFGDSAVTFKTWLQATDWDRHFSLKDAYIRALHERFQEEHIVIPFPIRTLDVPEGTELTLKRLPNAPRPSTSCQR